MHGLVQFLPKPLVTPAQLALGHRIDVLDARGAIEDQQPVIDAVEHRLQPLLLGLQGVDIAALELAQGLGHQAEALAQGGHFRHRGQRQGDLEIALADLVGGPRQCLDGPAEALGDAVRGDKADHQHGQADQPEQPGDQPGAFTGACFFLFHGADVTHLHGVDPVAQGLDGAAEAVIAEQLTAHGQRFGQQVIEVAVGALDFGNRLTVAVIGGAFGGAL